MMAVILWYFWIYSFLGWILECLFARIAHGTPQRRCFLLLPLCPVYGLSMAAVLTLPSAILQGWPLFFIGGIAATTIEFLYHWACQRFLGVLFWDYSLTPGNFHGRVCLPFSLAWGALIVAAVRFLQPVIDVLIPNIPPNFTFSFLLLFTLDAVCSVRFLLVTHDVSAMRNPQ